MNNLYDVIESAHDALEIPDAPPEWLHAVSIDELAEDPKIAAGTISMLRMLVLLLTAELKEAKRYA